jgi:hypothetical protein
MSIVIAAAAERFPAWSTAYTSIVFTMAGRQVHRELARVRGDGRAVELAVQVQIGRASVRGSGPDFSGSASVSPRR